MHTPYISFHGLLCLLLMSRLAFSSSLGPLFISIYIVTPYLVVQMPEREKSSKWKYKEDEGGKKDAEKEKTRSREQE